VRSRPPGAAVLLDGKQVGTTPVDVTAAPGHHELTLSRERYATAVTGADAPGTVDVPLQRPPATLVVLANVPNATVVVSGGRRGNAPFSTNVRGYEKYNVEVSAHGVPTWRRSVYVIAPSTEVHANLGVARR
jgi:hypothetical protein